MNPEAHGMVQCIAASLILLATYLSQTEAQLGSYVSACLTIPKSYPCHKSDLRFLLYSSDPRNGHLFNTSSSSWLRSEHYDAAKPSVLLVAGNGDPTTANSVLTQAYIRRGSHNVILVDWTAFARDNCYVRSVWNMDVVARCMSEVVAQLQTLSKYGGTKGITCIGHSLGAHVCGIMSKYVPRKLDKIVALDPARPVVEYFSMSSRLDASDARIVQVIHTSSGFYALSEMQGTADFCVNDGRQPFCRKSRNPLLCSHMQSICFYAASLDRDRALYGDSCSNECSQTANKVYGTERALMGEHMDTRSRGMYCVHTRTPPYCQEPDKDPQEYGHPLCCPV